MEGVVFENNVADFSNYGFWLGFAKSTLVKENQIRSNRLAGIAVVSGSGIAIEGNRVWGNQYGIRLWREDAQEDSKRMTPSSVSSIVGNEICESSECGVLYKEIEDVLIEDNNYEGNLADSRQGSQ